MDKLDLNFSSDLAPRTIALEEYKQLWRYYERTLDERHILFQYYLRIVALPGVLLGGFTVLAGKGAVLGAHIAEFAPLILSVGLTVIALVGVSMFITYSLEARNARNYEEALDKIREYFRTEHLELKDTLILDDLRKKRPGQIGSIKTWRGSLIPFVNSGIIAIALIIGVSINNSIDLLIFYILSIFSHFLLQFIIISE